MSVNSHMVFSRDGASTTMLTGIDIVASGMDIVDKYVHIQRRCRRRRHCCHGNLDTASSDPS
jgi:hypothetical protein